MALSTEPRVLDTPPFPSPGPDRAGLRRLWPTLAVGVGMMGLAGSAPAGITLVSRDSTLLAQSPATGIDQSVETTSSGSFAEQVGTGEAPVQGIVAVAHQYSMPGMDASGAGLLGLFAEGEARAAVSGQLGDPTSTSALQLQFEVGSTPATYEIGGSLGAQGAGEVWMELASVAEPDKPIEQTLIPANSADTDGLTVSETGVLAAGQYVISLHAEASDDPGGVGLSSAYFNLSVNLAETSPTSGQPAIVPLPSAATGGGSLLVTLAAAKFLKLGRRRFRLI